MSLMADRTAWMARNRRCIHNLPHESRVDFENDRCNEECIAAFVQFSK
jgi:hypothetical protein